MGAVRFGLQVTKCSEFMKAGRRGCARRGWRDASCPGRRAASNGTLFSLFHAGGRLQGAVLSEESRFFSKHNRER